MKGSLELLVQKAREAIEHSYSPFSNFKVGAAIQLKNGQIIAGTNVENSSYGLTNCAERSALFAAYSLGYRQEDIVAMCIATKEEKMISPCGACRQVMADLLLPQTPVYIVYGKDKALQIFQTTIQELLPFSFGKEDLHV